MSDVVLEEQQRTHDEAISQVVEGRQPIDGVLLRLSDYLNPILVKETRQALKSQQFMWTFVMVLIGILGWTIAGVTLMLPGLYFLPGGPTMMVGYFAILMTPVGIVIPIASFFSMSSELEDGTHDILSLSALHSRQVVLGKIQVGFLQSLIYFSALTPCIALTYLLRGVAIDYIFFILLGTMGLSVLMTTLAITFATLTKTRSRQVLLNLLLFGVLIVSTLSWYSYSVAMMRESIPITSINFWFAIVGVAMLAGSYVWLAVLIGAAKIGIASENHSTGIRFWLLMPHLLWLWFAIAIDHWDATNGDHWFFFLTVLGIHWGVAGVTMVGESGYITPRARRSLPKSPISRLFLTWLNPGGGPGYVFCILTSLSVVLAIWASSYLPHATRWRGTLLPYSVAITSYLAFYLGMTRLIVLGLQKFIASRMLTVVAVLFLVVVFGVATPMLLSFWGSGFRTINYEYYSFTHFPWTLMLLSENNIMAVVAVEWLSLCALVIFVANLLMASKDVMLVRVDIPEEVLRETRPELVEQAREIDPLAPES